MPFVPVSDYTLTHPDGTEETITRLATKWDIAESNVFAADLGAPGAAVANSLLASSDMKVGSYTPANAGKHADGLAHNVTLVRSAVGAADTPGTILLTGLDVAGDVITETLIPGAHGVTVVGTKAFEEITSMVGAGWVINEGNDTIVIGTGNLIGLPVDILALRPPVSETTQVFSVILGSALVAVTATIDEEISLCTVDASAGTYNGVKRLTALIAY